MCHGIFLSFLGGVAALLFLDPIDDHLCVAADAIDQGGVAPELKRHPENMKARCDHPTVVHEMAFVVEDGRLQPVEVGAKTCRPNDRPDGAVLGASIRCWAPC